jgi:hypothetical protein
MISNWTFGLWVFKCLAELVLLYTTLTRRVKVIWILASYTFSTSLLEMIVLDHFPERFKTLSYVVDLIGTLMFMFIFIQLVFQVVDKKAGYLPILMVFNGTIFLQLCVMKLNQYLPPSPLLNRINIILWVLPIFGLTYTCSKFPKSLMWVRAVDLVTMAIIPPHKTVLVPPNHQGG